MPSYECTQTCTSKKHANLLTYQADILLHIPENGFQDAIKYQGSPFVGFAQAFSTAYCSKQQPERALTVKNTAMCTVDYTTNVRGHIDDQPMLN